MGGEVAVHCRRDGSPAIHVGWCPQPHAEEEDVPGLGEVAGNIRRGQVPRPHHGRCSHPVDEPEVVSLFQQVEGCPRRCSSPAVHDDSIAHLVGAARFGKGIQHLALCCLPLAPPPAPGRAQVARQGQGCLPCRAMAAFGSPSSEFTNEGAPSPPSRQLVSMHLTVYSRTLQPAPQTTNSFSVFKSYCLVMYLGVLF